MSDETRPDREALALAIRRAVPTASGFYGELTHGDSLIAADAVLALLPAPHPQGDTDNEVVRLRSALIRNFAEQDRLRVLLHGIKALCDQADFVWRTWPWRSHVATSEVRALLAAAPAPTEAGDPHRPGALLDELDACDVILDGEDE